MQAGHGLPQPARRLFGRVLRPGAAAAVRGVRSAGAGGGLAAGGGPHADPAHRVVWEGVDEPLQVVHRQVAVPVAYHDWRELSDEAAREQLSQLLAATVPRASTWPRRRCCGWRSPGCPTTRSCWSGPSTMCCWTAGAWLRCSPRSASSTRRSSRAAARAGDPAPVPGLPALARRQDHRRRRAALAAGAGRVSTPPPRCPMTGRRSRPTGPSPPNRCRSSCPTGVRPAAQVAQRNGLTREHRGAGRLGAAAVALQRPARCGVRHHGVRAPGRAARCRSR